MVVYLQDEQEQHIKKIGGFEKILLFILNKKNTTLNRVVYPSTLQTSILLLLGFLKTLLHNLLHEMEQLPYPET